MNKQVIKREGNIYKDLSVSEITGASADYLRQVDCIDFAVIFGSFAEGKVSNLSDIDIGIFINTDISLMECGSMTIRLESILKREVDIVILNDLYKRNPLLAYEIISKGGMILCKDETKFREFKKNTLLYFMDTKGLRDMMNDAFRRRLNNGKFGESNYA
jgi:predicted nucleotidyltransferase